MRAKSPSESTVLVVDDEADLREIIAFDFESAGYQVETAENGIEAIKVIEKGHIDAIVSDIRMPKSDGVALLQEIKKEGVADDLVMVFITGFSDLSIQDAFDMGIQGFFSKPFDRRMLVQSIGNLLIPAPERWTKVTTPPKTREGETIKLKFSSLQGAIEGGYLAFGRGGMFIAKTGQYPGIDQRLPLLAEFEDGSPSVEGVVYVRWTRSRAIEQLRPGIGVEFESLTPSSIKTLTPLLNDLVTAKKSKAFIPKG